MVEVPLVDLEVILRYSLAIRQEAAPARELLDVLDASRATVEAALRAAGEAVPGRPKGPGTDSAPSLQDAALVDEDPRDQRMVDDGFGDPRFEDQGFVDEEFDDEDPEDERPEDEHLEDDGDLDGDELDEEPEVDDEPARPLSGPERRKPLRAAGR